MSDNSLQTYFSIWLYGEMSLQGILSNVFHAYLEALRGREKCFDILEYFWEEVIFLAFFRKLIATVLCQSQIIRLNLLFWFFLWILTSWSDQNNTCFVIFALNICLVSREKILLRSGCWPVVIFSSLNIDWLVMYSKALVKIGLNNVFA